MSDGLSIRPQTLHLSPRYRRLRDAILRPHLRLTESRYFWERWKARLGPDATVLIMEVRDRCNRALAAPPTPVAAGDSATDSIMSDALNGGPESGALRDGCTVSASELATACGFSRVTLWRILQREDVRRFITVEHNYVYDRRMGKKRRTVSTYHVHMEDPLVEEDEARLQALLEGQTGYPPSRLQIETEVGPLGASTLQPETANSGSSAKPQNVPETILNQRLGANGTTGTTPTRPAPLSLSSSASRSSRPAAAFAPAAAPPDARRPGPSGGVGGRETPGDRDSAAAASYPGRHGGSRPAVPLAAPPPRPARAAAPPARALTARRDGADGADGADGLDGGAGRSRPGALPAPAPAAGPAAAAQGGRGPIEVDLWRRYPDLAHHVEEAERLLGDAHSRGFYLKALKQLFPAYMDVWQRALGLAREQQNIRRSRGALFTRLLRTFAAEAGVTL